jgi:hypothetical protein
MEKDEEEGGVRDDHVFSEESNSDHSNNQPSRTTHRFTRASTFGASEHGGPQQRVEEFMKLNPQDQVERPAGFERDEYTVFAH